MIRTVRISGSSGQDTIGRALVLVIAVMVTFSAARAAEPGDGRVLVREGGMVYGYGRDDSIYPTQTMDIVLGDRIVVVEDFNDLQQVLGSDALWVDLGAHNESLNGAEIENIKAFIDTGRRVVMWGERDNYWGVWDNDILSTVGSQLGNGYLADQITTQFDHFLTRNVNTITIQGGAEAPQGEGTSLFDRNVVTLWGELQNVLTILDTGMINCLPDYDNVIRYFDTDNEIFVTNVIEWVGVPGPAPTGVGATVFLSPITEVGGGAVLANPHLTVQVGQTITLGVWLSAPEGLDVDRIALDLLQTAGILRADSFVVTEGGPVPRWDAIVDPNLNDSAEELFAGSYAIGGLASTFGLTGGPLRPFDANFDPNVADPNGAFLYAIIQLTPTALGDTDLYLKVGAKKVGYTPDDDTAIRFGLGDDPVFRTVTGAISSLPDATIHVVPEPATFLLLGAAVPLVLRRRVKP